MLPHLLLVGTRNSNDQGPVGPCMRPSGERGDGSGPINGEIGPPPPPQVSLTPPGMTSFDSYMLKDLEEEDRCPMPGSAATRAANRRVQYKTLHCSVRVLHRLGA
jgi:hypothetical protein